MGFLELLRRAFEVRPHVLELRGYLLLQGQLLHVNSVVGVGGHGRVGVLLPCVGLRPADDDLKTVVVDSAGEVGRQPLFFDELPDSIFHNSSALF